MSERTTYDVAADLQAAVADADARELAVAQAETAFRDSVDVVNALHAEFIEVNAALAEQLGGLVTRAAMTRQ